MKFFTPERYVAFQIMDDEAAMDAADAAWEEALDQYAAYLQTISPELPESVRQLLDGFYLHDADVLSMGRHGHTFVITLQLDVPPNELLTLTYSLAGTPHIFQDAFPEEHRSTRPQWLYEELELVKEGEDNFFLHSILFSNGWEVRLPFREVQLSTAFPIFPALRVLNIIS